MFREIIENNPAKINTNIKSLLMNNSQSTLKNEYGSILCNNTFLLNYKDIVLITNNCETVQCSTIRYYKSSIYGIFIRFDYDELVMVNDTIQYSNTELSLTKEKIKIIQDLDKDTIFNLSTIISTKFLETIKLVWDDYQYLKENLCIKNL